jgi:hypothetical protein
MDSKTMAQIMQAHIASCKASEITSEGVLFSTQYQPFQLLLLAEKIAAAVTTW